MVHNFADFSFANVFVDHSLMKLKWVLFMNMKNDQISLWLFTYHLFVYLISLINIFFLLQKRLTAGIPKQRTISINLKKNKEHEFSDYVRTIRASPSIPFKADQAPKAPVLKPSPSPILVKGPSLRKRLLKVVPISASQLNYNIRQTAADFFCN